MIEIFKYRKGLTSPIMNEIFMLKNNTYCEFETITYKGPQLWQKQATRENKKSSSLVSFKQSKSWKNPKDQDLYNKS